MNLCGHKNVHFLFIIDGDKNNSCYINLIYQWNWLRVGLWVPSGLRRHDDFTEDFNYGLINLREGLPAYPFSILGWQRDSELFFNQGDGVRWTSGGVLFELIPAFQEELIVTFFEFIDILVVKRTILVYMAAGPAQSFLQVSLVSKTDGCYLGWFQSIVCLICQRGVIWREAKRTSVPRKEAFFRALNSNLFTRSWFDPCCINKLGASTPLILTRLSK